MPRTVEECTAGYQPCRVALLALLERLWYAGSHEIAALQVVEALQLEVVFKSGQSKL